MHGYVLETRVGRRDPCRTQIPKEQPASPWQHELHDPWMQQEASLNWGRREGFQSRQEILLHKPAHQQTTLRHLKVSLLIAQESNQNTNNDYQHLNIFYYWKLNLLLKVKIKLKRACVVISACRSYLHGSELLDQADKGITTCTERWANSLSVWKQNLLGVVTSQENRSLTM